MEEIREKIGEYLKARGWKPVMDMGPVSEFAFGAVDPLTGKDHDELHALQIEWSRDFLQNQTK